MYYVLCRNSERTYKKLESHLLDPTLFQNPTVENIASFLKAEQEKFPNLKRLNAILLDRLREANSSKLVCDEWRFANFLTT